MDKKKILFYNDRTANFVVDDEFQKQWRAVAVESMDDAKIEDYLEKQVTHRVCFYLSECLLYIVKTYLNFKRKRFSHKILIT